MSLYTVIKLIHLINFQKEKKNEQWISFHILYRNTICLVFTC